jgi:hypothetical protein
MSLTLATARPVIARIIRKCATDDIVVDYINEALDVIFNHGRWRGTIKRIAINTTDGTVTWPREVGTVEKLAACKTPIRIRNGWYEMMDEGLGVEPGSCGPIAVYDRDPSPLFSDIDGTDKTVRCYCEKAADYGKYVLVTDAEDADGYPITTSAHGFIVITGPIGEGYTLTIGPVTYTFKATPTTAYDIKLVLVGFAQDLNAITQNLIDAINFENAGATTHLAVAENPEVIAESGGTRTVKITPRDIEGEDVEVSHNPLYVCFYLREMNSDDHLSELTITPALTNGFWLKLQSGYSESTDFVSFIGGIQKPLTNGTVTLKEWGTTERTIATYQADETTPMYRRQFIDNWDSISATCDDTCSSTTKQFTAIVKLDFKPVRENTDVIPIDNLQAIKLAVQAIQKEEADLEAEARAKWKTCWKELNHELQTKEGEQIAIRVNVHGSANPGYRKIGRLV